MEESQSLLTKEEEGQEELTPPLSRSSADAVPVSVSVPSMTYFPPLETVPLGPPPEYNAHPPAYTDKPFPVLLQDGRQGVLVRDVSQQLVKCVCLRVCVCVTRERTLHGGTVDLEREKSRQDDISSSEV